MREMSTVGVSAWDRSQMR